MSYNDVKLSMVVIFGRTNVGKSTLFNCLIEKRQALVADREGTTRDSNIGLVNWRGRKFNLVDTGGIIDYNYLSNKTKANDTIQAKVQKQAGRYLKQADLVLFLVDNKAGLLSPDKELALALKKIASLDKIILVANKVDKFAQRAKTVEFYRLGLGEPLAISAANGSGSGDLLDVIFNKIKTIPILKINKETGLECQDEVRVCIIGKPNVGKSSLLNSILGYERVIVSPTPHTTREPQDTEIIYDNQPIKIIDTAGISRKARLAPGLEKLGIAKSLAALARSDLALLVLDISQPITREDNRLADEIVKRKKSLIIVANKWDEVKERQTKKYTDYIKAKLPFIRFAPIQFTSALTGEKTKKILSLILEIKRERCRQLEQSALDDFLSQVIKFHRPTKGKGVKHPRISEFKQILTDPPKFILRIGIKEDLHFSYLRFMENRLRGDFGFLGTPITIKVVKGMDYKK